MLGLAASAPRVLLHSWCYHKYQLFSLPHQPSFKLILLHGNIAICSGCHQRFPRKPSGIMLTRPITWPSNTWNSECSTAPSLGCQQVELVMPITTFICLVCDPTGLPYLAMISLFPQNCYLCYNQSTRYFSFRTLELEFEQCVYYIPIFKGLLSS